MTDETGASTARASGMPPPKLSWRVARSSGMSSVTGSGGIAKRAGSPATARAVCGGVLDSWSVLPVVSSST